MEKKARLLAERPADWITVKYVDEPYRVRVETAHAKICFAKDGSMESFYDRDLDREWTDVFMTHGIFCRTTKRKSLRSLWKNRFIWWWQMVHVHCLRWCLAQRRAAGRCRYGCLRTATRSKWNIWWTGMRNTNLRRWNLGWIWCPENWCAIPAPDLYAGRPIRILPGSRQDLRCVCINGAIWQSRTAELRS